MGRYKRVTPLPPPSSTARIKIALIGAGSVGKSTIIQQYIQQQQQQRRHQASCGNISIPSTSSSYVSVESTVGVALHVLPSTLRYSKSSPPANGAGTGSQQTLRIQPYIYDFSGNLPCYKSIYSELISDIVAYICVYNPYDRESFQQIENQWLTHLSHRDYSVSGSGSAAKQTSTIHYLLIGNNSCSTLLSRSKSNAKQVTDGDISQWCAQRHNAVHVEYNSSSMERSLNILKLSIDTLIQHTIESMQGVNAPLNILSTAQLKNYVIENIKNRMKMQMKQEDEQRYETIYSHERKDGHMDADESRRDTGSMTLSQISRELHDLQIPTDDCVEKSDFVDRLNHARNGTYINKRSQPGSNSGIYRKTCTSASGSYPNPQCRTHDSGRKGDTSSSSSLMRDLAVEYVTEWSISHKSIYSMLNNILGTNELDKYSTPAQVEKSYKRALLKIHPDKIHAHTDNGVGVENDMNHMKSTEMVKAVNDAYQKYKKQYDTNTHTLSNSKRGSGSSYSYSNGSTTSSSGSGSSKVSGSGTSKRR